MQVFHGEDARLPLRLMEDELLEERKGPRLVLWRAELRQTLSLERDIQEGEDQRHALVRVEVGLLQPAVDCGRDRFVLLSRNHATELPHEVHQRQIWRGTAIGQAVSLHIPHLALHQTAAAFRQQPRLAHAGLARAGRYRDVADNLRVKEVYVGTGERRRRYVVCYNPEEAAREHAHRERLLELVRAELAALDARQADHPKKACELMASRRFGRYLRMDPQGRLSIDTTKVAAEAKYDGKFVVTTNDDTLDAEDVALGYTSLMLIEGCFRRMKTTGLQTRPIYHWRAHRIIAHVKLCVLALLLERAAELRCQQTWRTIRHTLDQLKVVRYRMQGKTILQSTQVTAPLAKSLRSLGIPSPKKILEVSE